MKPLREVAIRFRVAAVVLCLFAVGLFGVTGVLIRHAYRVAIVPWTVGHIKRTWTIERGRHHQHVRVADFTFTVDDVGRRLQCIAEGKDIGDWDFDPKPGDSIELVPIPGSCATPYVINIQPPNWAMVLMIGFPIFCGIVFISAAFAALSDPDTPFRLRVHKMLRRYGVYDDVAPR